MNDLRQAAISGLQFLVFIATAVAFLMWIHRAHKKLPALGAANLVHSPGWAVGGFFVPFLNLIRPYQVTREIWQASEPEIDYANPVAWTYVATSPLLPLWWVTFLGANILANIAFRLSFSVDAAPGRETIKS